MRKPQQPRHCAGWLSWCGWVYFLAMAGVQNCVKVMSASVDSMGKYSARLDGSVKLLNLSMISAFQRGNLDPHVELRPIFCHPHAVQPATLSSHPCHFRWGLPVWVTFDFYHQVESDLDWFVFQDDLGAICRPGFCILYSWRFDAWFIVLRKYMKDMKVYPSLLQVHRVWVKTIQNLPPAKNIPSTSSNKKYARECS